MEKCGFCVQVLLYVETKWSVMEGGLLDFSAFMWNVDSTICSCDFPNIKKAVFNQIHQALSDSISLSGPQWSEFGP